MIWLSDGLPIPTNISVPTMIHAFARRGPVVGLETLPASAGGRQRVAGLPWWSLELRGGKWRAIAGRRAAEEIAGLLEPGDPFQVVKRVIDEIPRRVERVHEAAGAYGFFGYEANTAEVPADCLQAFFLVTDVVADWPPGGSARLCCDDADLAAVLLHDSAHAQLSALAPGGDVPPEELFLEPDLSLDEYRAVYPRLREHLRRGDSYQLCFTYELLREFRGDPFDLYRCLCERNPAPYAAFVTDGEFSLVSSSPERFVSVGAGGRVEAVPMKGTIGRTGDPRLDAQRRETLQNSPKDRAENLMIADLLRNDLGRVCRLGSVRVTEALRIEEYATLFQMVSRIEGTLRKDCGWAELMASAFPPGSMTGAPKQRSVEILRRLERAPRGAYSGALGYATVGGTADFSVIIRSLFIEHGVASIGVGGGVVWDSTAEGEHQESRLKAVALLAALRRVHSGPWRVPSFQR